MLLTTRLLINYSLKQALKRVTNKTWLCLSLNLIVLWLVLVPINAGTIAGAATFMFLMLGYGF